LREIDHKNVIQYTIILYRLKDVVIDQKQLYLIFEYVDRDLKSYLESLGNKFMESYKIKVTIVFIYQILSGIADCHVKRVIHRDLKPANILVDKTGTINLIQTTLKLPILDWRVLILSLCGLIHKKL
jgi:serine/threonine protein kinase